MPIVAKNLTPLEQVVLAKMLSESQEKEQRELVKPGVYVVDRTFHLKGMVTVHPDCVANNHQRLQPMALLALVLDDLNEATLKARIRQAIIRLKEGKKPDTSKIDGIVKEAISELMSATAEVRKGQVRSTGEIEAVDGPEPEYKPLEAKTEAK